jgi:outer membrane beta-barrel protein
MAKRMDNRVKQFLLAQPIKTGIGAALCRTLILLSIGWAGLATAAEPTGNTGGVGKPDAVQVIMPEVQPRDVSEDAIDDESFEIGLYAGVLNIDNFGSEPVYGVRASYFATEDLFLQLNYGKSKAGNTSFEDITGNFRLLTDNQRDYTYYNILAGYNLFPGEVFMTSKLAFHSSIYLVGGVGNTDFAGEDNFTTTLGTGYRIILLDWLSWQVDFRDHIFKSDIINKDETTHNLELTTGITFFF